MSTVKNNWVTQCSGQSNMNTSSYRKLTVSGTQPHLSENLWFSNDFRVSKSGHIGLNSLNMWSKVWRRSLLHIFQKFQFRKNPIKIVRSAETLLSLIYSFHISYWRKLSIFCWYFWKTTFVLPIIYQVTCAIYLLIVTPNVRDMSEISQSANDLLLPALET